MSALTVTAAQVAPARPTDPGTVIRTYIANAALTPGQAVFVTSSGTVDLCSCNTGGDEQFRGLALQQVAANQGVDVIHEGPVEGFDLSGLAYDALVYAQDTAGQLGTTASGTKTVVAGRVVPAPKRDGSGNVKKLLQVSTRWVQNW